MSKFGLLKKKEIQFYIDNIARCRNDSNRMWRTHQYTINPGCGLNLASKIQLIVCLGLDVNCKSVVDGI